MHADTDYEQRTFIGENSMRLFFYKFISLMRAPIYFLLLSVTVFDWCHILCVAVDVISFIIVRGPLA